MSNALRAVMIIVVETTATVGSRSGNVVWRQTSSSVAPSTRAASSSSALMPLSAADRMTMQKPVQIQAATMMSMIVLSGVSWSQAMGSKPTLVTTAFSVPVWGSPGVLYAYMKFQMTLAPTKLIASGRNTTDLAIDS